MTALRLAALALALTTLCACASRDTDNWAAISREVGKEIRR